MEAQSKPPSILVMACESKAYTLMPKGLGHVALREVNEGTQEDFRTKKDYYQHSYPPPQHSYSLYSLLHAILPWLPLSRMWGSDLHKWQHEIDILRRQKNILKTIVPQQVSEDMNHLSEGISKGDLLYMIGHVFCILDNALGIPQTWQQEQWWISASLVTYDRWFLSHRRDMSSVRPGEMRQRF